MDARSRFPVIALIVVCAATVTTKMQAAQQQSDRPAEIVTSADQAIDRIIAREHEEETLLRRYRPIVETYVQDMKPDVKMGVTPTGDHYFLGQADLQKGTAEDSMLDKKKKSKAEGPQPFPHEKPFSYAPNDFLKMIYIDANGFDHQHYEFRYVGREFLGDVRCVVFDVTPSVRNAKGRFNGRIWAEDQGFAIVRFNGVFESSGGGGKGLNLHFDSWRLNLQPDLWLPAFVYSQDSQIESSSGPGIRFKAQTRLWGYNLASGDRTADYNSPPAEQAPQVHDVSPHDSSPIEAEHEWQERAEANVLDRLQRIGLVAPPGEVDKVLETVINNLEVTNNVDIEVHCRVLLTGTLESFSIGHTIVMSRGLIDVLPDEASLATALAQELATIETAKPSTDQWGFNDMTNVTAGEALSRLSFKAPPAELDRANQRAFELLKNSPYKGKVGNAALFFKQLSAVSTLLSALVDARLGNTVVLSSELASLGPPLQADKLDQVAALPLGARVKLDPWDDGVQLLKSKPTSVTSAREKMPFEVTPFLPFVTRYHPSATAGNSDKAAFASRENANKQ